MEIFKKRLNQLIEENKTTKYKVAKGINCNKQTVCNWADGKSEPTLTHIKKIAEFFDVSTDYLCGLEDEAGRKIQNITQTFNFKF